jgi:hypothetical protein
MIHSHLVFEVVLFIQQPLRQGMCAVQLAKQRTSSMPMLLHPR